MKLWKISKQTEFERIATKAAFTYHPRILSLLIAGMVQLHLILPLRWCSLL